MAILCLGRSIKIDFAQWLAERDQDLYLISSTPFPSQHKYRLVKRLEDLDADSQAEITALDFAAGTRFSRILPHSEFDLIRAARLREHLGVPGQSLESAIAYRDKVVMKEHMNRADIPVAHFKRLRSPLDVIEFIKRHGYPSIIKPVDGCSSKDIQVIKSRSDLAALFHKPTLDGYMIESFVEGRMFHVNGVLTAEGRTFFAPCAYINGSLDFQRAGTFGSRTLEPDTPIARRLVEFTRKVIAALPETSPLGFHAEIFQTPDDRLVLCEIAARTAGSLTGELIELSYGINIHKAWIRACAGIEDELPIGRSPTCVAASIRVPVRDDRLVKIPASLPFDWVSTLCITGIEGLAYQPAQTYTDDVLSAILVGDSDEQLLERIDTFHDWLNGSVLWESAKLTS
ncbi:ATP-grasp domain-containing protein [Pseudomonas chlororaphis]|uniref:ATP-grasp domain-containing protein n=1 Tax=Pseudomonas chlororaphis TaxID=587753 RepID=UPI0015DFFA93|nr:ATP-grasp domain-containing protein [Pseudomonas chlororaphis]QLL12825.1 ATP-grasp domain-containing protein [Pseudomonas chlororaphis subsp. aurantiaca]